MIRIIAKRLIITWLIIAALAYLAFAEPQLTQEGNRYLLKGAPLELTWNATNGALLQVRHVKTDLVILNDAKKPFDLHTDAGWISLKLTSMRMQHSEKLVEVTLRYEGNGWRALELYKVSANGRGFFSRSVELLPIEGIHEVKFNYGEIYLGRLSDKLFHHGSIVAPYTLPPLRQLLTQFAGEKELSLHCSQSVTGVGIYTPRPPLAFAVGQYWEHDWNRFIVRGNGDAVSFLSNYGCQGRLRPGLRIPLGGQFLAIADGNDYRSALRAIADSWQRLGFQRIALPKWTESIALYSLHPSGTMGSGIKDLKGFGGEPSLRNFQSLQLPILKRLGINAIWFLPIWPRGYGVSDYWAIQSDIGSTEDLRAVVQDAKASGIRVLCDLIPHGPHESSGLLDEHPEFVSRHEDGSILYWWGCLCCDYANPGWQKYMAELAAHWTKETDIDGWRVDCAAGAPPNWRPYDEHLPSWSGQWGGLRLMERVRKEMNKVKPNHVLLAESANPPMLTQAHFIYDWPTEKALFNILRQQRQEWVSDMRAWLDFQHLAIPKGAANGFMHFTENHDQLHSVWQLGPNLARPIWALCTFAQGFPLIYHEQEVGFEDFWSQLLHTRRAVPELRNGEADYAALGCSEPEVLTFVRTNNEGASIVAINFSQKPKSCTIRWDNAPRTIHYARELPTGNQLPITQSQERLTLTVNLPMYDWRVVVLRSRHNELKVLKPAHGMRPLPVEPKPLHWSGLKARVVLRDKEGGHTELVSADGRKTIDQASGEIVQATIQSAGGWRLVWRSGLLAGIAIGKNVLSDGMWLSEGKQHISWDKPIDFGERLDGIPGQSQLDQASMKTSRWRVSADSQGISLEYNSVGKEFIFTSLYVIHPNAVVEVHLTLTPRQKNEPIIGQLYMALSSPMAERWLVHGIEGDVGGPFFVRHPTPMEFTGRFWHPIQRLWEHSVQPLSLRIPALGWQASGHWLWVEMVDYPSDKFLEDIYLREYAPDDKRGLTTYIAWMEGRSGRQLNPEHPFSANLRLLIDQPPKPREIKLPVRFWADGANWYIENKYYRLCIARSGGGQIRNLWAAGESLPIVERSRTYTDYGILGARIDSLGRKSRTTGSTEQDFEPDCWIYPSESELRLHFRGFMRQAGIWRNIVNPRVQYETIWHFTASPLIHVEHRTRPLISPKPQCKAFLAQILNVPDVKSWQVVADGKTYDGAPDSDKSGRILESKRIGATINRMVLTTTRGKLQLDNLQAWGEPPQNVFLLRLRGSPAYVIFLAMLDGEPIGLDARWRGYSYDLLAVQPH